jgi:WD40 repeat protein
MPDLEPEDIAFSPDGKTLAVCRNTSRSGNDPWPIHLFLTDAATGRETGRLFFGTHLIFLEFSRDGRRLIYSIAGPVRLHDIDWKAGTGGPVYENGPQSPFAIDYCERTRTVACTLYGGGACVFPADGPERAVYLNGPVPEDRRARLAPDGRLVAVYFRQPLMCFRAPGGEPVPVPTTGPVDHCGFSPDGRNLAYIGESGRHVHFLDPRASKFAASFTCANDALEDLAFSPDGSVLATGTGDGSVLLWNLRGAKPLRFEYASEKEATESGYYAPDTDASKRVPAGARVMLKTAKPRYLLGEEIFVQFELSNVGRRPFTFSTGGDYRGATRHLSYQVEAIHADGEAMPDPNPNQMCFGGLSGGHYLVPGAKYTDTLDLLAYRRLERPGRYRIRASHGWTPFGDTTIEVAEPTPEEARAVVEQVEAAEAMAKADNPTVTGVTAWRRLTHPAYLPHLAERARAGSRGALEALGQMPDPGATRALIGLLDRPDPAFVADVEQALYYRLPDPELEGKVHRRTIFDSDDSDPRKYLRDRSWRPEFATAVRAHGRWLLSRVDEPRIYRGAFLIGCVGTPEDLPAVLTGFDTAVAEAQGKPLPEDRYPRPPVACAEVRRAVQMLIDRGATVPEAPKTPGEKLLFVEAVSRRADFRPPGWEETFVGILRDRFDYLREAAVGCVPEWCPKAIRAVMPDLIRDKHIDVQIAALHLAERLPQPDWKPAVVGVFGKAQEEWLLRAADGALYQHCSRVERIEVHIAKMADPNPKMASQTVEMLTHMFRDYSGGSNGIHLDTPEKRRACQEAWRKFVATHREQLEGRRPFSLHDDVPRADLFPGFEFSTPRRRGTEDE